MIPEYDETALDRLEKIYLLYAKTLEDRAGENKAACGKGCSWCCTCNVVLTSLEAAFLVNRLDKQGQKRAKKNLADRVAKKRYIPLLTTNAFAKACVDGGEVPEEENDPLWGQCPLLEDGVCTVYPFRPFGCRAMMSETPCRRAGFARMPPLVLTLNNIFLQYIEHLDLGGVTGNLSDLLLLFFDIAALGKEDFHQKKALVKNLSSQAKIILNAEIPVLLVPPEHRAAAGPVIRQITALT